MQVAKLRQKAREAACILTCAAVPLCARQALAHGEEPIRLTLTFCPPDMRRRDLDNMLASNKANLDGFADALRTDDHRFEFTLVRGQKVKGGAVEVTFQ